MRAAFVVSTLLCGAFALACTAPGGADAGPRNNNIPPGDPNAGENCGDQDPLTFKNWAGFCEDRVDDNCTLDVPNDNCPSSVDAPSAHNFCNTADEPCPATQPGSAPPQWDCLGNPPANVIAYASFIDSNQQVTSFCAYVYESEAFPGEHYVAVSLVNGPTPQGPDGKCSADYAVRRHLYFSNLDEGECPPVRYIHAYPGTSTDYPNGYPVDEQQLSNRCRKMIRNVTQNDPSFSPDIQFFAQSREEALAKLEVLDTAEIACVGIDNLDGEPYRTEEEFYVQASAPIVLVP